MIKFENPEILYLLAVVPLLALLFWLSFRLRGRALESFGNMSLVSKLAVSSSAGRQKIKAVIFIVAVALLVTAAARPRLGTKMELVKREGIDIVIAVDTSASMNAEDAMGASRGRRIDKAKHEISALLDILENDRVGLVAFAGTAHIQCPLTIDYDAVKIFLDVIDTDLIPAPGTAIGTAIDKAATMFDKEQKKHKAIILITDGEDHVSDPVEAAKRAEDQGIRIYPIGIGSPEGTPVPEYDESGHKAGMKKKDGELVLSKLDDATLEKVALITHGKYYPASLGEIELKKIHSHIAGLEKKELASRKYTHYEDRYQYLLALALLLLLVEWGLPTRIPSRKRRNENGQAA